MPIDRPPAALLQRALSTKSTAEGIALLVSIGEQRLYRFVREVLDGEWPVSTAAAGTGNRQDSLCTPTGLHRIAERIGEGLPPKAILQGRRPTGEIARIETRPVSTGQDLITSRILWLEGLEEGINSGGDVDSKQRCIYIHGTHEEGLIGTPASHGCIRLRNADILQLWQGAPVGTPVLIQD